MKVFMEDISDVVDFTISSLGSSCEIKTYKAFYFAINTKFIKLVSFLILLQTYSIFDKYDLLCASSV